MASVGVDVFVSVVGAGQSAIYLHINCSLSNSIKSLIIDAIFCCFFVLLSIPKTSGQSPFLYLSGVKMGWEEKGSV